MANLHKFIVTDKVAGNLQVDGNLYTAGDPIYLPEHQCNYFLKSSYMINGLVEYAGEVEPEDMPMTDEFMELYDAKFGPRRNILPVLPIKLATGLVANVDPFGVQSADSAGGFASSRRMYVSKIGIRCGTWHSVAAASLDIPWYLATAGAPQLVAPALLVGYDDTAGTYATATNGAVAAAAPFAWAADDLLIIGYTEKFASVMCDMTAACTAGTLASAFYWTAEGWKQFVDHDGNATFTDYTRQNVARTMSRAAAGDKTRMVWWAKPTDWIPGGPNGSGANDSTYCVAIQFDGALTNLAGGSFYPVLDKPLANMQLGSNHFEVGQIVSFKGGLYITALADLLTGWGGAGDFLYIGFPNKFDSLYVDMSANVNANASVLSFAYWNGAEWLAVAASDGTIAPAGTTLGQDGWITITAPMHPSDWAKVSGPSINANLTDAGEFYWFRINSNNALSAATAATAMSNFVPATNTWVYFPAQNEGFVEAGEPIMITCQTPEANIGATQIMAVASDI